METPKPYRFWLERWMPRTRLDEEGCWIWQGPVSAAGGYPLVHFRGQTMSLHRASYLLFFGLLPKGIEIHHLCQKPRCWRPDHLEAVTALKHRGKGGYHAQIANQRRYCHNGHEFTEDNKIPRYEKGKEYQFRCKTCHYNSRRRYENRWRAERRSHGKP